MSANVIQKHMHYFTFSFGDRTPKQSYIRVNNNYPSSRQLSTNSYHNNIDITTDTRSSEHATTRRPPVHFTSDRKAEKQRTLRTVCCFTTSLFLFMRQHNIIVNVWCHVNVVVSLLFRSLSSLMHSVVLVTHWMMTQQRFDQCCHLLILAAQVFK